MIALLLSGALALAGAGDVAPVTKDALLAAFDKFCLTSKQPMAGLESAALAAGYRPATLKAPKPRSSETGAWESNGIRVFALLAEVSDGQPRMPVCGVEADVGAFEDDIALVSPLRDRAISFATGHSYADGSSDWSMAVSKDASLHLVTDRSSPDHVIAAIFVEIPKAAS